MKPPFDNTLVHSTELHNELIIILARALPIDEVARCPRAAERTGRGGKTDKETDREVGRDGSSTERWRRRSMKRGPPSASAASLRSDTLYFLMKREADKKENFSSAKITQMWRRRTRGRMTPARLRSFTCAFLDCFIYRLKETIKPDGLRVGSRRLSQPCWVDGCHCEAQVLRGLRPPRGTPAQTT